MKKIAISPSVMCADLVNLENSIKELEAIGVDSLHIDLIDGLFSPSMPLGIDTVKKLRKITNMEFDVHIMSMNNELFINEMLDIGAESITFHYESSFHTDRLINLVKRSGAKVGVALNPATSLSVLDYILPQCDSILLMLINPGFATDKGEKQVSYADKKVKDLSELIRKNNLDVKIQVDGRVSLETIPKLVSAGADSLVVGSTSLFIPGNTISENKKLLDISISEGLKGGNFKDVQKLITEELAVTLGQIEEAEVERLLDAIQKAEKVFFVGVGRVLLSLEATAKRLAHLGIKTYVVGQITEPAITEKDLLIVGSGSGESAFPLIIAKKAKSLNAAVAHIGSNPNSSMKENTDIFVRIPVSTKLNLPNEVPSVQPMTSLFEQSLLLLGDTLALMIIREKNIDMKSLWQYHANLE